MKSLFDMVHQEPRKVILFGDACSNVTDQIVKAARHWNLVQVKHILYPGYYSFILRTICYIIFYTLANMLHSLLYPVQYATPCFIPCTICYTMLPTLYNMLHYLYTLYNMLHHASYPVQYATPCFLPWTICYTMLPTLYNMLHYLYTLDNMLHHV